ncbi:hypothetical protein AAF712_007359 [Marasmius tenuissimus]|uniref:AMP-dependent synthetase/ligase domain-containing protein n=1 Tax=Marasmius tenuissimus TaxID=585030 RepID=A0ABR2ZWV9_9AGAR
MTALRAPKFQRPPLDGSLSIAEIYDWHVDHNPNHPIFVYATGIRGGDIKNISYSQFSDACHRAGFILADLFGVDPYGARDDYPVVGILSTAGIPLLTHKFVIVQIDLFACFIDTITTYTTIIGLLRLGVVPFPISPRFSAHVVAELVKNAKVSHLLVNNDRHLQSIVDAAVSLIQNSTPVKIHSLPENEVLYSDTWTPRLPKKTYLHSSPGIIVHSSSSTSEFPKVVPWTVGMQIQHARVPVPPNQNSHDLRGAVFSCHSIELFHAFGLLLLYWTPAAGFTLGTFKPSSPAVLPSAEFCFHGIRVTNSEYALTHTRFLEEWATDTNKLSFLKTLKAVLFGGKVLKQSAGEILSQSGVKLSNTYGSTEGGHFTAVPADHAGECWDYFQRSPQCGLNFLDQGDGTFHGIVIPTAQQESAFKAGHQETKYFATGDLMVPHPTRKDYWKVIGRVDDQIMLSSGEVVHPIRLENIVTSNPYIKAAQLFGQARPHLGVLVDLRDVPQDLLEGPIESLREVIWPTVQLMNDRYPSFCSVSREMIVVVSSAKPMLYTPKGLPKRAQNLRIYRDEIDKSYEGYGDPLLNSHPALMPRSVL